MSLIAGESFQEQKDYDPMGATLVVGGGSGGGGAPLVDVEQIGISTEKSHGLNNTVDNNAITVDNVPRVNATAVVYATADNIDSLESIYANNESVTVSFSPSEDAGDSPKDLEACRIQSMDRSNVEIDGIPTWTIEIEGYDW